MFSSCIYQRFVAKIVKTGDISPTFVDIFGERSHRSSNNLYRISEKPEGGNKGECLGGCEIFLTFADEMTS
jgi:hypothetical protein